MKNVFPIPDELKNKVTSVHDNRKPGQTIKIDAKKFVHIFRSDLESWLEKLARERAQNP